MKALDHQEKVYQQVDAEHDDSSRTGTPSLMLEPANQQNK